MYSKLSTIPECYDKNIVKFNGPKIIGFFSCGDGGAEINNMDISKLKFIKNITSRDVNFDLHLGYEQSITKIYGQDLKLKFLLEILLAQDSNLFLKQNLNIRDGIFFCTRGLQTTVAITPYDTTMPWRLVATLFNGDIYLCLRITEKQIRENCTRTLYQVRARAYGHKFEHFMVSDCPNSDPNPNSIFNENDGFYLVHQTELGGHRIIYTSEVDAILACDDQTEIMPMNKDFENIVQYLNKQEFIELKTYRHFDSPKIVHSFQQYKSLNWWVQCYLSGIKTILCGFKNDNRYVDRVEKITISDLIKNSKVWKPQVCINFLDELFSYIKICLEKEIQSKHPGITNPRDLPLITLHFERKLNTCGDVRNMVEVTDNYDPVKDCILPEYFVTKFGKSFS